MENDKKKSSQTSGNPDGRDSDQKDAANEVSSKQAKPAKQQDSQSSEIDNLRKDIADLKTHISSLEADKAQFREELKNRDDMLSQTNDLLSKTIALFNQERKQPVEAPESESRSDIDLSVVEKEQEPKKKLKRKKVDWTPKKRSELPDDPEYVAYEDDEVEEEVAGDFLHFLRFHSVKIVRSVLLLLAVALVIWFVYFSGTNRNENHSDMSSISDFSEDSLDRSSISKLIGESRLRLDDRSLPYPVRFDNANKRSQIADSLLSKEGDESALEYGTRSKIQSLTTIGLLNLQQGTVDQESCLSLQNIAEANVEHTNQKIAIESLAAKAFCSVVLHLNHASTSSSTNQEASTELKTTAIRDFEDAAMVATDDLPAARILFDVATFANKSSYAGKFPELLHLLRKYWLISDQERIRNLAIRAYDEYMASAHPLTNVAGGVESDVDLLVAKLSSELDELLDSSDLDLEQCSRVTRHIAGVVQNGRHDEARMMIRKALEKTGSNDELKSAHESLQVMLQHIDQIGQPFSIDGLMELDGNAAKFRPEIEVKLVLFISTAKYRECIGRINSIGREIYRLIPRDKVSFAVVYLDYGSEPEQLLKLNDLKRVRQRLDVWKLQLNSETGQAFADKFPIPTTPFLLVVDDQDRLVALNPPRDVILSKVFDLLEQ